MKFQTQWNRKTDTTIKHTEPPNDKPSKTIPDQTMSIKEILTRYASGIPISGARVPVYDEHDQELPADWDKLDLSEQQDILKENRERIKEYQQNLQKQQDEKHRKQQDKQTGKKQQDQESEAQTPKDDLGTA